MLFDLTPDQKDLQARARALAADVIAPRAAEVDRSEQYPWDNVKALTEAGFLSVLIPEEYGGSGLGLEAACAVLEEIHRSGSNGGACHAKMYTMGTLLKHGWDQQKREYLPKIASGELRLQAFGVTEPGAGTDTTRISTFAKRDGDRRTGHENLAQLFDHDREMAGGYSPRAHARAGAKGQ